jgi:hypothetical protein
MVGQIGDSSRPSAKGILNAGGINMNWFRLRVRSAAQLALFALVVQMVLSFGHLHRDDLGLPPLPTADQARINVDSSGASAPQHHNQKPDDYCPICASMALIATAVPCLPPAMIVPEPIQHVWSEPASAATVTLDVTLSFRARAPPMV